MIKRTLPLALGLLAGCSSDSSPGWNLNEPRPERQIDASFDVLPEAPVVVSPTRFDGWWRIDQPAHAGYEATAYEFQPGGVLVEGDSQSFGSGQVPVGRVAHCVELSSESQCLEFGVECLFGTRWQADGDVLTINGECSDGHDRDILLTFQPIESDYMEPHVDVVPGQTWRHNDSQWRWARCDSQDLCMAFE